MRTLAAVRGLRRSCRFVALGAAIVLGAARAHAGAVAAPVADGDVALLDVSSDPQATILIDDVDTGRVTPQARLEVKPGHHKLTLVTLDGKRRRTLGFTAEAGQITKLTVHLAS